MSSTIGVAIPIPEPYGTELQAWRERFGDPLARFVPTHITLAPPVPVAGETLPRVEEHLHRVARQAHPFSVLLRGTGTFRPVSPVVFVAVAQGISDCELLASRVRRGPLESELTYPYHPHVTVAHDLPEQTLDRAFDQLAGYEARFSVGSLCLYEHCPDGVWRPQRNFPFDSPGGGDTRGRGAP